MYVRRNFETWIYLSATLETSRASLAAGSYHQVEDDEADFGLAISD